MCRTGHEAAVKQLTMLLVRKMKGVAAGCLATWRQKAGKAKYEDTVNRLEEKMNKAGQDAGVKQLQMLMVRRVRGVAGSCLVTWKKKAVPAGTNHRPPRSPVRALALTPA